MKLIIVLLVLFLTNIGFAQKQNTYFLKLNGSYVSKKDSADYIRVVQQPDSGSVLYNVYEYYKDGKKKLIGRSSKISPLVFEGQVLSYFPNGKKRELANYHNNQLNGMVYSYYPNGNIYNVKDYTQSPECPRGGYLITICLDSTGRTLVNDGEGYYTGFDNDFRYIKEEGKITKGLREGDWKGGDEQLKITFTEQYAAGRLIVGVSTDEAGNKHQYQARETFPFYRDGENALYKFIINKINSLRLRNGTVSNLNGTAVISFIVDPRGKIDHVRVLNSEDEAVSDDFNAVISESGKGWSPACIFGIPERHAYVLTMKLKTEDSIYFH